MDNNLINIYNKYKNKFIYNNDIKYFAYFISGLFSNQYFLTILDKNCLNDEDYINTLNLMYYSLDPIQIELLKSIIE